MLGSALSALHVVGSGLEDRNLAELDKHCIGTNFLESKFHLENKNFK